MFDPENSGTKNKLVQLVNLCVTLKVLCTCVYILYIIKFINMSNYALRRFFFFFAQTGTPVARMCAAVRWRFSTAP